MCRDAHRLCRKKRNKTGALETTNVHQVLKNGADAIHTRCGKNVLDPLKLRKKH
jgi:hypothetical protein